MNINNWSIVTFLLTLRGESQERLRRWGCISFDWSECYITSLAESPFSHDQLSQDVCRLVLRGYLIDGKKVGVNWMAKFDPWTYSISHRLWGPKCHQICPWSIQEDLQKVQIHVQVRCTLQWDELHHWKSLCSPFDSG